MAFSKDEYGKAVEYLPTKLPLKSDSIIAKDVKQILEDEVDDSYYMASQYWETLKKHKERERARGNGFGYAIVNAPGIEHPIANTILATGGSGKERNLIYQPKEGTAGKKVRWKKTPINDEGIRVMTPKEWGRLQGFIGYAFLDKNGNEGFSFPDNTSNIQQYKQFGNSVTIPVIFEMAKFMLESFDNLDKCQKSIVLQIAAEKEFFNKKDVIEALHITTNHANYLLRKLNHSGQIELVNRGKYTKYRLRKNFKE